MTTIKTVKGAHGNKIKFQTYAHLGSDAIVVHDCDCQMERVYRIGRIQELDDFEEVLIKSKAQVMRAWENGTVWF
jgi:hypothetical protein